MAYLATNQQYDLYEISNIHRMQLFAHINKKIYNFNVVIFFNMFVVLNNIHI